MRNHMALLTSIEEKHTASIAQVEDISSDEFSQEMFRLWIDS